MNEIELLKWKHDINMRFLQAIFNAYIVRQGTIVAAGIALMQVFDKLIVVIGMVALLLIADWNFKRSTRGIGQASVALENSITKKVMRRSK